MPRVSLLGKPYDGKSIIANAQRCVNLYPESNQGSQAPSPITYYQFPGTELFGTPLNPGKARCSYRTTVGTAYVVVGGDVYFINLAGTMTFVGGIPNRASQVYMADNGLAVVLVDGVEGWAIDIVSNSFGPIVDPNFYGADFVVFLDTFFVFNRPNTNQFYISLSMVDFTMLTAGTSFDPLDIAAKSGSADPIVAIITVHKELWLVGALTTEIWIGTGAADFYFQIVQGAYIDHGCIAPYSASNQDVLTFWLMQDKNGKNIVVKGQGYDVEEISTPYLVNAFNNYETTDDAIGFSLQIQDHAFYMLVFPTANATWVYDLKLGWWFEWLWYDPITSSLNRSRANCCMYAFEQNFIADWETGKVYKLNPNVYTDFDGPILWMRTFLHMVGPEYNRVIYKSFDADMEVGNSVQTSEDEPDPTVDLSWSDDRGKTFGFPLSQSLGRQGEFLTTVSWNRTGWARDRVFKLQWSAPVKTALNGAFVDAKQVRT